MRIELTARQKSDKAEFKAFVDEEIAPFADRYDREERLPPDLIEKISSRGYLGAILPTESGGMGMDMITYGILNEEIGRACSSVRSLLTVHGMVSEAVLKWGSRNQKESLIPRLASGKTIAAFCLTEPDTGSDARNIKTIASASGGGYELTGVKKWITAGQIADIFLVIAQLDEKPTAFLIDRNTPGLTIKPISGLLGVRASMLAELDFRQCPVDEKNILGRAGFGFSHVASYALDHGRYGVAWGCVGIARACLEACLRYTSERKQFGAYLKDHQLIRQMVTDMITNVKAARLLCYQAGYLRDAGDPGALQETSIAKYFASTIATRAANDATQIHGANGCGDQYPVQRYLRDAKIMEIIEGSTQIQQITIAQFGYQEYPSSRVGS